MIPQLAVTSDKKREEKFLTELKTKYNVTNHYILRILPQKESIGIDDIRAISHLILTHVPSYRIIAIYSFETATVEAQNALLKMLEEKNEQNIFVLFTKAPELAIPTVASRSRIVQLDPSLKKEGKEKSANRINTLMKSMAQKENFSYLLEVGQEVQTKEDAITFIDELIIYFRQYLGSGNGNAPILIRKAFQIKSHILSLKCNPQLSLDNLLIFIHKTATIKVGHEKK